MVDRTRKMVLKKQTSLRLEYRTLEEVLKEINELIIEYGKDATIRSYCDSYSNSGKEYLHVMANEPETDKEMVCRIAQEELREEELAARDKADYARLQKLFGEKK